MLLSFNVACLCLATFNMFALKSRPITYPLEPTFSSSAKDQSPVPQHKSSTRTPSSTCIRFMTSFRHQIGRASCRESAEGRDGGDEGKRKVERRKQVGPEEGDG